MIKSTYSQAVLLFLYYTIYSLYDDDDDGEDGVFFRFFVVTDYCYEFISENLFPILLVAVLPIPLQVT